MWCFCPPAVSTTANVVRTQASDHTAQAQLVLGERTGWQGGRWHCCRCMEPRRCSAADSVVHWSAAVTEPGSPHCHGRPIVLQTEACTDPRIDGEILSCFRVIGHQGSALDQLELALTMIICDGACMSGRAMQQSGWHSLCSNLVDQHSLSRS